MNYRNKLTGNSVIRNLPANTGETGWTPSWEDSTCHEVTKPECHNY